MIGTVNQTAMQGRVEAGWGKVADVFRANFDGTPGEVGAACCVYVDGRPVADRAAKRPWDKETIVAVASTTKGAAAICAHLLVQRGELDLDAPVVKYWPAFGAAGKEQIPVRWLLSHQAGLPIVDGPLTFEEACAWHPVIRALEAQKPVWEPGTEHVYHSVTFGFLVGELVRRITGKPLGRSFLYVARLLAGLPGYALGRARVVRSPRLRWIGCLRRPRCQRRLRLRHEFVVIPGWRTTSGEPSRGGRGLPRVTDALLN